MSSLIWGLVVSSAFIPGSTTTYAYEYKAPLETEWTKQAIIEEIQRVFPDAPVMVAVARCESGFVPHAFNPTNNSNDGGVYQISEKYHGKRLAELGFDRFDVKDNIAYARILFDESGLQPWLASKPCWTRSPHLSSVGS